VTQDNDQKGRQPQPEGSDGMERELSRVLQPAIEPAPELADLLGSVKQQIARERGIMAWTRSRTTPARTWIAAAVVGVPAVLTAVFWLRPDIGVYPVGRMIGVLALMVALIGLALSWVLRPLYRPALPSWAGGRAVIAAAVLGLLLVHSLPMADAAQPAARQAPRFSALVWGAEPCWVVGSLLAVGVFFVLVALDRGGFGRGAAVRASAGGLCANLVLQLHCPNTSPLHLLLGHFGVLACMLLAATLVPRSARD
jgi:hypothetical protein